MEVTGSGKLGEEIMNLLLQQVRTGMSRTITQDQRMEGFMTTFSKEFQARVTPEKIEDAIIPIYSQHLSLEDIQSLTRFYQTPAGQHVIQALPQIVQESQAVGAQMGQKAALETLRGMSVQYPELKQILPPDDSAAPAGAAVPAPTPNAAPATSGAGAEPAPKPSAAPAPRPVPSPQQ
jgi:hypothetical protein